MTNTSIESHFDKVASSYDMGKEKYSYYYSNLKKLLKKLIGRNKKVYEFGCGTGDLLVSLNPKIGYGSDVSSKMIEIAKTKYFSYKNLHFSKSPTIGISEQLDFVFMSDVIEHLDDPEKSFTQIKKLMGPKTEFIITMANPIWEPLLMIWEKLGLKMKEGPHKRIGYKEIRAITNKVGMKITKHDYKLLIPIDIPIISNFANKYLERYLKPLAFIEYFVISKA